MNIEVTRAKSVLSNTPVRDVVIETDDATIRALGLHGRDRWTMALDLLSASISMMHDNDAEERRLQRELERLLDRALHGEAA